MRDNLILQWSLLLPGLLLIGLGKMQLNARKYDSSILFVIVGSCLCITSIAASFFGWFGLLIVGILAAIAIIIFVAHVWAIEESIREREGMNK